MILKSRKNLISSLLLFIAIAFLASFIGLTYFVRSKKPGLEQVLSTSLGMQTSIQSLHISLLPPAISAKGVEIENNGSSVAKISDIKAYLNLLAMLKGQLQIPKLNLIKPEFKIKRLENGKWTVNLPSQEKKTDDEIFIPSIFTIQDGIISLLVDEKLYEIRGIGLTLKDMKLSKSSDNPFFSRVSMVGDFRSKELRWDNIIITNLTSHIENSNGQFIFDPINFKALNGSGKGKVKLEMDTGIPVVTTNIELSGFRIEDFFSSISMEDLVRGEMELLVDLKARIGGKQELRSTIKGNALMKGRNLTITKLDIDNLLEEYMESQQFDLVDLGAIAIIGPIGPALTKAYDFRGVLNAASGGSTEVRQLMSLWLIKDGKASAQDVALATNKNRIALIGDIDIVANRFQNLNVVVVDDNGCSLVSQEMNGSFDNPEIAKPSFKSATGPFINIFKKATSIITKKECEVIYNGAVASPNN